jgi:hypothetical protein
VISFLVLLHPQFAKPLHADALNSLCVPLTSSTATSDNHFGNGEWTRKG